MGSGWCHPPPLKCQTQNISPVHRKLRKKVKCPEQTTKNMKLFILVSKFHNQFRTISLARNENHENWENDKQNKYKQAQQTWMKFQNLAKWLLFQCFYCKKIYNFCHVLVYANLHGYYSVPPLPESSSFSASYENQLTFTHVINIKYVSCQIWYV